MRTEAAVHIEKEIQVISDLLDTGVICVIVAAVPGRSGAEIDRLAEVDLHVCRPVVVLGMAAHFAACIQLLDGK